MYAKLLFSLLAGGLLWLSAFFLRRFKTKIPDPTVLNISHVPLLPCSGRRHVAREFVVNSVRGV